MFTVDDAKRMCLLYEIAQRPGVKEDEATTGLEFFESLLKQFAEDVEQQVRAGTLRTNAVYRNLIDHPAGFSFGFAPDEGETEVCLTGKMYTAIYDGDYKGINQAGYVRFKMPVFDAEVMEALKPLFGRPSPNGGQRFVRYAPPMMPPEKIDAFFEKDYLEMDWDTYGLKPENPILLARVSHAYTYLKSLLFGGASICFERVGSMHVWGKSHPVDHWVVCIRLAKEMNEGEEPFPFTLLNMYTYSYHVTSLVTIPPARGNGFEMNPMFIETYCPWEDEELISQVEALRKANVKAQGGAPLCELKGYDDDTGIETLFEDFLEAKTEKVLYLFKAWRSRFDAFIERNPSLEGIVGIDAEMVKKLCILDAEELYTIVFESYVCPWNDLDMDNDLIISQDKIRVLAKRVNLSNKDLMVAATRIAQYLVEKGIFPLTGEEMEKNTLEELKAMYEM